MHTTYDAIEPYVTKDGSQIRELMHPSLHCNRNQSLAEATVAARAKTALHRHKITEEIYHITSGTGMMTLDNNKFPVVAGDTVCIMPGTPHCIENKGDAPLKILCVCSPAYAHEDTELLAPAV